MKFKNDMGRSMIEMLMYLSLIVVIGTTTVNTYMSSVEKTRTVKAESLIRDIVEKVNTWYLGRNFSSSDKDLTTKLKENIPELKLVDPWGNNIAISVVGEDDENKDPANALQKFGVKFSGLSKSSCITVWNLFSQQGATNVKISDNSVNNLSTASASCEDSNNTVEGIFKKS